MANQWAVITLASQQHSPIESCYSELPSRHSYRYPVESTPCSPPPCFYLLIALFPLKVYAVLLFLYGTVRGSEVIELRAANNPEIRSEVEGWARSGAGGFCCGEDTWIFQADHLRHRWPFSPLWAVFRTPKKKL